MTNRLAAAAAAVAIVIPFLLSCGGGNSPAPSAVPTPPPAQTPQDVWVLTGKITAYGTDGAVSGAHATIDNGQATDTDSGGMYRFSSQTRKAAAPTSQ